ncbi:MAG: ethanolamine utilization protein EutN [Planctomycetia bacterium]|nr:ethanolamine utilization protein EutN [Planctomycetia bacterium]
MQLGKVVGHAISTVKHPTLNGWKMVLVQMLTTDSKPDGEPVLAIDALGAGSGMTVLLTTDAVLVREMVRAKNSPIRFAVMGLVDET